MSRWPALHRLRRRLIQPILWAASFLLVAILISLIGIELAGGIAQWEQWLKGNAGYFRLWRMLLYAALAYAWYSMHRRLLAQDIDQQQRRQITRTAIALVVAALLLELHSYTAP